jgi:hypothetical protein
MNVSVLISVIWIRFFDREKEWLQDILHGKSLLKGSIYETDESSTGGSRSGACL